MEILGLIGDWLKSTFDQFSDTHSAIIDLVFFRYKKDIKLSGVLYLHRISDNRMSGSPYRNLRMFGELCGDKAMKRVCLVSTMWDRVAPDVAEKRETDMLGNYWKSMTESGARHNRFDNKEETAWKIVDDLIGSEKDRRVLLLQEELVELKKRLNETSAGLAIYADLLALLEKQRDTIRTIENANPDPTRAAILEREHAKAQQEIDATFMELKKMRISLRRRIVLFFRGNATSVSLCQWKSIVMEAH